MNKFGVSDVVGRSFRLVLGNFGAFLGTQGVFILAAAIVSIVSGLFVGPTATGALAPGQAPDVGTFVMAAGLSALLGFVSSLLITVSVFFGIVVAEGALEGRRVTLADAWAERGTRFGTFLGAFVLATLIVLGVYAVGMVLFFLILPPFIAIGVSVWLMLRWYVSGAVATMEDVGAMDALRRSTDLTDGAKGRILLLVLALVLVFILVSLPVVALQALAGGASSLLSAGAASSSPGLVVAGRAWTAAVQLVLVPVGTVAMVLVYRSLREDAAAPEEVEGAPLVGGGEAPAP